MVSAHNVVCSSVLNDKYQTRCMLRCANIYCLISCCPGLPDQKLSQNFIFYHR